MSSISEIQLPDGSSVNIEAITLMRKLTNEDLNNIIEEGYYYTEDTDSVTNKPSSDLYNNLIKVERCGTTVRYKQTLYCFNNTATYERKYYASDNLWTNWLRVDAGGARLKSVTVSFGNVTLDSHGVYDLSRITPISGTIPRYPIFAEVKNFLRSSSNAEGIGLATEGRYVTGKASGVIKELQVNYFYYEGIPD